MLLWETVYFAHLLARSAVWKNKKLYVNLCMIVIHNFFLCSQEQIRCSDVWQILRLGCGLARSWCQSSQSSLIKEGCRASNWKLVERLLQYIKLIVIICLCYIYVYLRYSLRRVETLSDSQSLSHSRTGRCLTLPSFEVRSCWSLRAGCGCSPRFACTRQECGQCLAATWWECCYGRVVNIFHILSVLVL